jgi:hypothetical protein
MGDQELQARARRFIIRNRQSVIPVPQSLFPSGEAGNGTRTRDPNLGKVVLYQLSYSREVEARGIEPLTS